MVAIPTKSVRGSRIDCSCWRPPHSFVNSLPVDMHGYDTEIPWSAPLSFLDRPNAVVPSEQLSKSKVLELYKEKTKGDEFYWYRLKTPVTANGARVTLNLDASKPSVGQSLTTLPVVGVGLAVYYSYVKQGNGIECVVTVMHMITVTYSYSYSYTVTLRY
jgi:hypothetical protein